MPVLERLIGGLMAIGALTTVSLVGALSGSLQFLGVAVPLSRLAAFLVAPGVSLAVWWVLEKTGFGRAVRSVSQVRDDPKVHEACF